MANPNGRKGAAFETAVLKFFRAAGVVAERLTKAGAKVLLASHCGRPQKKPEEKEKMRMAPMAARLGELIGKPVATVKDCIGPDVDAAVAKMKSGDVLMLENARFYKEEEKNNSEFAQKLAKHATIFVRELGAG